MLHFRARHGVLPHERAHVRRADDARAVAEWLRRDPHVRADPRKLRALLARLDARAATIAWRLSDEEIVGRIAELVARGRVHAIVPREQLRPVGWDTGEVAAPPSAGVREAEGSLYVDDVVAPTTVVFLVIDENVPEAPPTRITMDDVVPEEPPAVLVADDAVVDRPTTHLAADDVVQDPPTTRIAVDEIVHEAPAAGEATGGGAAGAGGARAASAAGAGKLTIDDAVVEEPPRHLQIDDSIQESAG